MKNAEVIAVAEALLAKREEERMVMRTQAELRRKVSCMWCGKPCLSTEVEAHEAECGA